MGLKMFNVLTSAEKNETITVIGFCNAAGQFLAPVVKYVDMKQETADDSLAGSDWYMNREWPYIFANVFLHVLHRALPETKSFMTGHSSFRWLQSLVRFSFNASDCC
jgi:hypothetical protein